MNIDKQEKRGIQVVEHSETKFTIKTQSNDIDGYSFSKQVQIDGFTRQELVEALQNALIEDTSKIYKVTSSTDPISFWVIAMSGVPAAEDYRLQAYTDEELQAIKKLLESKGYKEY